MVAETWDERREAGSLVEAPWTHQYYSYEGARTDLWQGRDLGFDARTVENPDAGTRTRYEYDPLATDPAEEYVFAGLPVEIVTEVFERADASGVVESSLVATSVQTIEYQVQDPLGPSYFVYPHRTAVTLDTDGERTLEWSTEVTVDDYGATKTIDTTAGAEHTQHVAFEHVTYAAEHRHHVRRVETTRCHLMDCTTQLETIDWTDAGGPIRPVTTRAYDVESSSFGDLEAAFENYDVFGNVLAVREKVRTQERVTSFEYNTYDALAPHKTTNALGHETHLLTHPVFGTAWTVTDPNGLLAETRYDAFGRAREVRVDELSFRREITDLELADGGMERRVYGQLSGYMLAWQRFDAHGRPTRSGARVADGGWLETTTSSNAVRTGGSSGSARWGRA